MNKVSYNNLFDSDLFKLVKQSDSSNSVKINTLKKLVAEIIKNELTEKQRQILDMYFVRRMSYTQIAEILKVNKSTISRTKSRAFKTIANILKYYNF